jgi:hypothetical protein
MTMPDGVSRLHFNLPQEDSNESQLLVWQARCQS